MVLLIWEFKILDGRIVLNRIRTYFDNTGSIVVCRMVLGRRIVLRRIVLGRRIVLCRNVLAGE